MRSIRFLVAILVASVLLAATQGSSLAAAKSPFVAYLSGLPGITQYTYTVVNQYPHDPMAFTEGLLVDDGMLYESTGLYGASSVRKVSLETGTPLGSQALGSAYFGEGLALRGDTLYQLTWKNGTCFTYDKTTLVQTGMLHYDFEGWGLAADKNRLIASDGSAVLRFLDPATLAETGRLTVHAGTQPVPELNELEVVNGEIYANVWKTPVIVIINPRSGHVTGWVDLTGLTQLYRDDPEGVLNGIAYDADSGRLFVTGKRWPKVYEIKLEKK